MAQVIVRSLNDRVVSVYKERARQKGHSLEQELRDTLIRNAQLSPEKKIALARKIRSQTTSVPHPLAEDLIREERDRR